MPFALSIGSGIALAAGVGAIGAVAGGVLSGNAAKSAAKTQADAAARASDAALRQQEITREDLAPFRSAGVDSLQSLRAALGLPFDDGTLGVPSPLAMNGIGGLTFQPTQAQLEATPGYQFDLSQGLRGVESSAAARGLGISGAALKGAAGFATGLANNTLTTQQQIFQQNLGNVLNPLMSLASQGENASAQTGQLGQAAVNSSNAANLGGAASSAAGQVGSANAIAGGINGLGNSASNFLLFNALNNNAPSAAQGDATLRSMFGLN